MAKPHRDGRVLPEQSSADLDWVVCRTSSSLVPRWHGCTHVTGGVRDCFHALFPTPGAPGLLLDRYAVGDRRHSDRQLCLSKLSCARTWFSLTG